MALTPATNKQIPDHSIMDHFDKQVYLGQQYTATKNVTIGTSEVPLLLINNVQTGSSVNLKALFLNLLKVNTETALASVIINVYLNPTITAAGTALVPTNSRPAYGVASSIATITSSPTDSAIGTLLDSISCPTVNTAVSNVLRVLDNGQSILITGLSTVASTAANITIQWYEL